MRRCYSCRSRGKLGDCKDPVSFNATKLMKGVEAVPCASGWCSKIIEGKKDGEGKCVCVCVCVCVVAFN